MIGRHDADFSLSGLKTALRLEAEQIAPLSDQDVADLCASFQLAVVEMVVDRLRQGLRIFRQRFGAPTALVAAGGVAANQAIRDAMLDVALQDQVAAGGPAAVAVHRQCRHDRVGRRGAARPRPVRYPRHLATRPLAAGSSHQAHVVEPPAQIEAAPVAAEVPATDPAAHGTSETDSSSTEASSAETPKTEAPTAEPPSDAAPSHSAASATA